MHWEKPVQEMSEQEVAEYYQAHKDDLDDWEEAPPPRRRGRPGKGLKFAITIRFSEEESAIIRRAAEVEGATFSEAVRRAVRAYGKQLAPRPA